MASAPAVRTLLEQEREAALRLLTVSAIAELIEAEVQAGAYDPPVDPDTLAYAIVRLAEAFIYNDAVAGIAGTSIGCARSRPPCWAFRRECGWTLRQFLYTLT